MEKKSLSLQEKMVFIRARIPALVKRAYSEEVNYDFTKIDDIFRYLTPAMNEYKVNWEIESETTTKKDDAGNPVYICYLERPMVWLYEADLAIRWINAEQPEDTISVKLHAIGTHEVPEKAKGSGWTYALKYYLLDKYCIDQGGEDPDMRANYPVDGRSLENYGAPGYMETYDGEAMQNDGYMAATEKNGYGESQSLENDGFETSEEGFAYEDLDDRSIYQEASQNEMAGNGGAEENSEPAEMELREGEQADRAASATATEADNSVSETSKRQPSLEKESPARSGANTRSGKIGNEEITENAGSRTAIHGRNTQTRESGKNQTASQHIRPENGRMVELPESAKQSVRKSAAQVPTQQQPVSARQPAKEEQRLSDQKAEGSMTLEEACGIICTSGLHKGERLGDIAQQGEEGLRSLRWFAYDYRGRDVRLKEGARLLLMAAQAA